MEEIFLRVPGNQSLFFVNVAVLVHGIPKQPTILQTTVIQQGNPEADQVINHQQQQVFVLQQQLQQMQQQMQQMQQQHAQEIAQIHAQYQAQLQQPVVAIQQPTYTQPPVLQPQQQQPPVYTNYPPQQPPQHQQPGIFPQGNPYEALPQYPGHQQQQYGH